MILKSQLKIILFIEKHINEKDLFIKELFKNLDLLLNKKLPKKQFNIWLDACKDKAQGLRKYNV